jgi:hypothetical protein
MYKIRIKGLPCSNKDSSYYIYSTPVDITVYADTLDDAIEKVKPVLGHYISTTSREVFIEEIPGIDVFSHGSMGHPDPPGEPGQMGVDGIVY